MSTEYKFQEAQNFYEKHYKVVGQWFLVPGQEIFLGKSEFRRCRFCGQDESSTTFDTLAHAIPEAMGNKSLFSYYECDSCNHAFGIGIERDFGEWSKPTRAMTRIKGKSGVPKLVKDGEGKWRIEVSKQGEMSVHTVEDAPVFTVNEQKKEITFNLTRGNFTPVAVLKAFMKIGLTLMPELYMFYFLSLREWIKESDHAKGTAKLPVLYTFQPGPLPNDELMARILIRKSDHLTVPFAYLVIGYGNEMFQVQLPSSREPLNATYEMMFFPYASSALFAPIYGHPKLTQLDLSGTEKVKDLAYPFIMSYGEISEKEIVAEKS